jgi:L-serine dehydratase
MEAMRQIGEEMSTKFKEISLGGLAVKLPNC